MALPTKLSAGQSGSDLTTSLPRDWAFLLSRANSYRSMDEITLIQRDEPWYPGMLLSHAGDVAALAADIHCILCHGVSTRTGPRMATVVTRDAEVVDALLIYGAIDPTEARQELSRHAIIVRQAVLPNTTTGTFDPTGTGPVITGIPGTPVTKPPTAQPTYPKEASFAPSTLEAAEPDMPAAGSPNPAPPTTPVALSRLPGESDEAFQARQDQDRQRREEQERQTPGQPGGPAPSPPEAPRT